MNVVGPYSPFDAPGETLSSYALFHLDGEFRIGPATALAGIRNLLNRHYPELRAGDFIVPGQPRTVFLSLRYTITGAL